LATLTHIAVIWLWHTPPIYDAAVNDPALHLLEHATFLASAVWFWSEIRSSARRSPRTQGIATLCLGAMIVQGGVLGATITFASRSLYDVYSGYGTMGALEDQQLAGALMWVPPSLLYASAAVRRFIGWFDLVGGADPPPPLRPEDGQDRPPDRGIAVARGPTDPPR
jgi:putative membrane protein